MQCFNSSDSEAFLAVYQLRILLANKVVDIDISEYAAGSNGYFVENCDTSSTRSYVRL